MNKERTKCERNEKGQFIKTTNSSRYKRINRNHKNLQLHRYIYEKYYNVKIPKGYVIHHINGNKKDNHINNLQMLTYKEHNKLHSKDRTIWNKGLTYETSEKIRALNNKKSITMKNKKIIKSLIILELYNTLKITQKSLGEMLSLSRRQICEYLRFARLYGG